MFNKSKRTLGIILAGLMVTAAFAGCSSGSGSTDPTKATEKKEEQGIKNYSVDDVLADAKIAMSDEDNVKLKLWAPTEAVEVFQKQCDDFCAAMKKLGKTVTVEVAAQSEADGSTLLKTDPEAAADILGFASDQGLDLFKGNLVTQVRLNFVEPVKESNLAGTVDTVMFKGTEDKEEMLYAYPETGDNGYVLYYDKRILNDEDVKSLEGVMKVCNDQKKNLAIDMGNGYYGCIIPFTGGGTLEMAEDMVTQKLNYDYEKIGPVADAFAEVLGTSKYFKSENVDQTLVSGFTNGTYAGGVTGSWQANNIKDVLGDNMGCVKLPTIKVDGKDTQITSIFGYKNLGVNSKCKNQVTAHSLTYYLSSEDCQKERFEKLSWGPSIKALVDTDEVQNNVVLKALYDQQQYSVPQKEIVSGWWGPTGAYSAYCVDSTKDHSEAKMKEQFDAMVEIIEMG